MSNLRETEPRERDNGVIKEAQLGVNTKNGAAPNKPDSYPPNGPAEERVWQGSIEVLDIVPHGGHYEGVVSHLGLYERISAHPPSKVSLKAYEFSKQMAEVLQCKLHPLREQWPENFQTYIPDGNDVGLYFYPKKLLERPSKKYSTLLKFITKNDLMLKTCMGDVELLIFPSTQLRADCQKNYYVHGANSTRLTKLMGVVSPTLMAPVSPTNVTEENGSLTSEEIEAIAAEEVGEVRNLPKRTPRKRNLPSKYDEYMVNIPETSQH